MDPQQSEEVQYEKRWNLRGFPEHYITGQHVSLQRLKENPQDLMRRYISKEIPPYPNPVEFSVSDVTHVTEESGFDGIFKSEQIRPPESEFSWWDLKINKEEIRSAEVIWKEIIWKAQAICETHHYQFCSGEVQPVQDRAEFYVWDLVSLVFHLPKHSKPCKALKIPRRRLIEALEACELDIIKHTMDSNSVKTRNATAKMNVSELKKELEKDEEEEESKEDEKIKMEVDDCD